MKKIGIKIINNFFIYKINKRGFFGSNPLKTSKLIVLEGVCNEDDSRCVMKMIFSLLIKY